MENNNWEEEFDKSFWEEVVIPYGVLRVVTKDKNGERYIVGCNHIKQFISNLLTKKDQEHKAELEMIKEDIINAQGFSICSIHQKYNETCSICGHSQISKEDALSIIGKHINK